MFKSLAVLAITLGLGHAAAAQPLVTADWLKAHLGTEGVAVLDLRPAAEYAAGHMPGAVSADYEHSGWRAALPDGAKGALPPIDRIAGVIGRLGVADATRAVLVSDDFGAAARVYWTFRVLGHDDVSILDGGWKGWSLAGDPVDTVPVAPRLASFTPRYDPSLRAELPEVAAAVASGEEVLLDARPPGQWAGTTKAPTVAEYGHLPHAAWIDQTEALEPDGRLKPKADLARLFGDLGSRSVITYCNTGHLAATNWFVLSEVLHKSRTKMYDGSLSEWTADPSRPIVREQTVTR